MPTLNWLGKDKVVNHHQEVPFHVLEKQYTHGETSTENMLIKGDNLLALKSLLPQYEGKIKCIYIDPPYNTGNEGWVYNDNVNDPKIQKWLKQVVGKEGEDLTRHDKWLCMMYPRLRLLQRLLADDGAIFISIDDNEQANLKLICDEIFGTRNFLAEFVRKRIGGRQDSKHYAIVHEYVMCYAKNALNFVSGAEEKEAGSYPKFDELKQRYYKTQLLRKWGSNSRREDRPNLYYPIIAPDGTEVYPMFKSTQNSENFGRWRHGVSTMQKNIDEGRVEFIKQDDGSWIAYEKIFAPLEGEKETKKFTTWIESGDGGATELKAVFGESVFDYPKSTELLQRVLQMATSQNSIILDSFAGSGTTAHAVLNLNKQDGGNRKFILVEMEDYAEDITAERIRRVIDGYTGKEGTGGGFSFYELGERLLHENGNLNEEIGTEKICEYIWYTETRTAYQPQTDKYYLGENKGAAYYFYYEKDKETVLSRSFLEYVQVDAEQYVIYADVCAVATSNLKKWGITFKKIPRDIKKF
jgi:adenine-specific DNA-methyltransferase